MATGPTARVKSFLITQCPWDLCRLHGQSCGVINITNMIQCCRSVWPRDLSNLQLGQVLKGLEPLSEAPLGIMRWRDVPSSASLPQKGLVRSFSKNPCFFLYLHHACSSSYLMIPGFLQIKNCCCASTTQQELIWIGEGSQCRISSLLAPVLLPKRNQILEDALLQCGLGH